MKLAISTGHWPESPGHAGEDVEGRWSEYALLSPITGFLIRELHRLGHQAWAVPSGALAEKCTWVNQRSFDLAVELHGNADPDPDRAGDPEAMGCEVIHHPEKQADRDFAANIAALVSAKIGEKNRGAKPGWYRQDPASGIMLAWTEIRSTRAFLIEVCFIDTPVGRWKLRCAAAMIGEAIAESLVTV